MTQEALGMVETRGLTAAIEQQTRCVKQLTLHLSEQKKSDPDW